MIKKNWKDKSDSRGGDRKPFGGPRAPRPSARMNRSDGFSGGDSRPPRQFNDRPRFGSDRPRPSFGGGDRPRFGSDRPRPSFGGDRPRFGGAPRFGGGDRPRPSFGGDHARTTESFSRAGRPSRPPFRSFGGGDRPRFGSDRPRPSFGGDRSRFGGAPRFGGGDRPRPSFGGDHARTTESFSRAGRPSGSFTPFGSSSQSAAGSPDAPKFDYKKRIAPAKESWGDVATWYNDVVEAEDSYQKDVILPNLLRLAEIKKGEKVLDIACGQGFFSRAMKAAGAEVIGTDISQELVDLAKKKEDEAVSAAPVVAVAEEATPAETKKAPKIKKVKVVKSKKEKGVLKTDDGKIEYVVAPADKLPFGEELFDKATMVLAAQNMESFAQAMRESSRVLKQEGRLYLVLNHPAFRIPRESAWGYDERKEAQFRRVDRYLSELKVAINMHPGERKTEYTASFHRPLQFYFKALKSAGFVVASLEELISNKKSEPGGKSMAEDRARKEIPMFMVIEAIKK